MSLGGGNSSKYGADHTCQSICIIALKGTNWDVFSNRKLNANYSDLKRVLINTDFRPFN